MKDIASSQIRWSSYAVGVDFLDKVQRSTGGELPGNDVTNLRRDWRKVERALRGDSVNHHGESGRTMRGDSLGVITAVVGLLFQLGLGIWWGSKIENRVSTLEENDREERRLAREDAKEKVALDALQTTQIEVMKTDMRSFKETLERIDRKLPERAK